MDILVDDSKFLDLQQVIVQSIFNQEMICPDLVLYMRTNGEGYGMVGPTPGGSNNTTGGCSVS